jgi:hypothetical protein
MSGELVGVELDLVPRLFDTLLSIDLGFLMPETAQASLVLVGEMRRMLNALRRSLM